MGAATDLQGSHGALGAASAPVAKAPWPTFATVVGAIFSVLGLSIGLAPLSDNSFITHLATGRLIVDGTFPRTDPYSFTADGVAWTVQSWLVSTVFGLLDQWFGLRGVQLLVAAACAGLAASAWALAKPASSLGGRALVVLPVIVLGATFWAPRPLLVGLIAFAVVLLAADGRFPAPLLLPVFWLWVQSHGSFPLGLVALAALAAGRAIDQRGGRSELDGEPSGAAVAAGWRATTELRALAWAAGGTVLGVVGPLGFDALAFPVRTLGRHEQLQVISEWQSPDFSATWARVFLVQVLVAVVLLVRRPSARSTAFVLMFVAASLIAARNVPFASLAMVAPMARAFPPIGRLRGDDAGGAAARVALAAVALVGAVLVVDAGSRPPLVLSAQPVEALAWTDEAGLLGGDHRVLTEETTGNYLELLRGADAQVFLDDRLDMYPTEVVDDYLEVLRGRPGWSEVLDEWNIDVVVWERQAPLAQLLAEDEAWHVGYADAGFVVACRRPLPCGG